MHEPLVIFGNGKQQIGSRFNLPSAAEFWNAETPSRPKWKTSRLRCLPQNLLFMDMSLPVAPPFLSAPPTPPLWVG